MQSTLSLDWKDPLFWYDVELTKAIEDLKGCIRSNTSVPLDVYTKLEDFGIEIDKLIAELEAEIYGESDFNDSYWGC